MVSPVVLVEYRPCIEAESTHATVAIEFLIACVCRRTSLKYRFPLDIDFFPSVHSSILQHNLSTQKSNSKIKRCHFRTEIINMRNPRSLSGFLLNGGKSTRVLDRNDNFNLW